MMESMLLAQQKQYEYIKQLASKVDVLSTHNKMLEAHIAQQVISSSTPTGRFPSKPEPNPREQCNAMILREGKQLEGPKGRVNDVSLHDEHDKHDEHDVSNENEVSATPTEVIVDVHKSKEPLKDSNITFLKPYNPPLPFPQRMAKAKLDLQFGKFLRSSI